MADDATRLLSLLQEAVDHLDFDADLDRLGNPRHTDHDRYVYLPQTLRRRVTAAVEVIDTAFTNLSEDLREKLGSRAFVDTRRLMSVDELLDRITEPHNPLDRDLEFMAERIRTELVAVKEQLNAIIQALRQLEF